MVTFIFEEKVYLTAFISREIRIIVAATITQRYNADNKFYPDFIMHTLVDNARFDIFAIQVKPPGQIKCLTDHIMVGYELQKMIDKLVDASIPSPVVCGVWVDGITDSTYKMDLYHNGQYIIKVVDLEQSKKRVVDNLKIEEHQFGTRAGIFQCPDCSSNFSRIDHITEQRKIHLSNRETFECPDCSNIYKSKSSLFK